MIKKKKYSYHSEITDVMGRTYVPLLVKWIHYFFSLLSSKNIPAVQLHHLWNVLQY